MKLKSLGYNMKQERLYRNKADYELDCKDINEKQIEVRKKTYKEINEIIEQLQNRK